MILFDQFIALLPSFGAYYLSPYVVIPIDLFIALLPLVVLGVLRLLGR